MKKYQVLVKSIINQKMDVACFISFFFSFCEFLRSCPKVNQIIKAEIQIFQICIKENSVYSGIVYKKRNTEFLITGSYENN